MNPDRPFIDNIDEIPFPARHLIDNNRHMMPHNGRPMGVIKVSRGCPYHCFFCLATPISGREVRMRSPDSIVAEVRHCIERYGIRDFVFYSDVFNMDKEWVIDLCRKIIDSGLNVSWSSNLRVSTVDQETVMSMRKAGCFLVSFGVESGVQNILDKMGKGIELGQVREAMHIFKKAGLKTYPYYLVGLPWDTRQTVEATVRFSIDLDSDYAGIFTATPFPGTRFFEYAVENRLFESEEGFSPRCFAGAYLNPAVRGHHLSSDEIASLNQYAVRSFFMRPDYIAKHVAGIRSWKEFYRYSRTALALIGNRISRGNGK